jgi:hypothetical protein
MRQEVRCKSAVSGERKSAIKGKKQLKYLQYEGERKTIIRKRKEKYLSDEERTQGEGKSRNVLRIGERTPSVRKKRKSILERKQEIKQRKRIIKLFG